MNRLKLIKSFNSTAHKQSLIRLNSSTTKVYGEQNTFYFEESILLKSIPKSDPLYKKLYDKIPVVLVLGWTGCVDNHIYKYKSIYSNLGYHTIRFSPSNKLTFINYKNHSEYASQLVKLINYEYKLVNNPIIAHLFSNACFFILYQHILNEIQQPIINKDYLIFRQNLKCSIFDSGPGYLTDKFRLINGLNDLIKTQINNSTIRYLISVVLTVTFHLMLNSNNYFTKMFEIIANDSTNVPILSIYSKEDRLISSDKIKGLIDKKKRLYPNLYIKEIVYESGDHIQLLIKHNQDYLKNIKQHLEYCQVDMEFILKQIESFDSNVFLKQNLKAKL